MGSRPVILWASAIIKWWFQTSKGLRKMTTWYCYKMKIGFQRLLSWGYLKGTLKHCKVTIGKDMCFTGGGFEEALIFLTKMASSQPKTGLPWRAWKRSMLSYKFGKGIEGVASESPRVFATKWDWDGLGFNMLLSEGQLALPRVLTCFLRRATSLARK